MNPNRPTRSISKDPVNPSDFMNLNIIYCCEQCSHFDDGDKKCTFGYNAENHRREAQLQLYNTSGRMAFCRILEID